MGNCVCSLGSLSGDSIGSDCSPTISCAFEFSLRSHWPNVGSWDVTPTLIGEERYGRQLGGVYKLRSLARIFHSRPMKVGQQ